MKVIKVLTNNNCSSSSNTGEIGEHWQCRWESYGRRLIVYMLYSVYCVPLLFAECNVCYLFNVNKHWTISHSMWKILLTHFRQILLLLFVEYRGCQGSEQKCSKQATATKAATAAAWHNGAVGVAMLCIERLTYTPIALNIASFILLSAVCRCIHRAFTTITTAATATNSLTYSLVG